MASPVIQFKRGAFTNLPGLRAGEPALTTDTFDLYVGIDSTTNNNKFFGSHRYWTKETSSKGSSINLVEGTSNGTDYISLKSPDNLAGIVTYTLPGVINDGYFLKVSSNGTLTWENVTGSGASFADVTLTGITTIQGSFNVSATTNFTGVSTFSSVDINGGSIDGTTIGLTTPASADFTTLSADSLNVSGISTVGSLSIGSTQVISSAFQLQNILSLDATTIATIESAVANAPNTFTDLQVTGISTFQGNVNIGDSSADTLTVNSTATFVEPVVGTISTATALQNARDFSITGDFITAAAVSFNGTGNVGLAATLAANSVVLGTYTSGDYVASVSSGAGLTGGTTGEGSTPTLAVGAGEGITVNADDVALKNGTNLSNNTVLKWNNTDNQLTNSSITDDGSTVALTGNLQVGGSITGTATTATRSTQVDTTATTTSSDYYLTFVDDATSQTGETIRVDSGIKYNPGTDTLTVPVIKTGTINASDGSPAITINDVSGNVSVASSLTVTGDLTVLGSQTIVNTTELKVEDNLIDLGLVNSGGSLVPPSTDANIDIGVLFNYYTTSAKKSGIFWDDSTGRIGIASDLTVTNGVVDTISTIWAPIEIGALWVNDCAGQSQVINCSTGVRILENITVDGGTF